MVVLGPESREVARARPVHLAVVVLLDFSSHIAAHTAREQLEILEHLETPILYTHTHTHHKIHEKIILIKASPETSPSLGKICGRWRH